MAKKIVLFFLCWFWVFEPAAVMAGSVVLASWYGSPVLEGNLMANGEPFKSHDKTIAAHRTLPFGTKLRVKNPVNGRELVVTVKDRGPKVRSRRLDLSLAAARELGYTRKGVIKLAVLSVHRPVN